jgi:hypothetical protein
MSTLDQHQIKEIAEQLDCGNRAFCHKITGELIFIPDTGRFPDMDLDVFDEGMDRLEEHGDEFVEIESMRSGDAYRVMADFADQVTNRRLQASLLDALGGRGPFAAFKQVIDNSGAYREQWFDFKNGQYIDWVARQVAAWQSASSSEIDQQG